MKTMEEYKVLHDSITSLVKLAGEDSIGCVGKSFFKFEKLLDNTLLRTELLYPSSEPKRFNCLL